MWTYPVVTGCNIENRLESQPDDACGVHGEPDELGLVEVLRAFACFEGVDGAKDDEDAVVGEGHEHAGVLAVTLEGDHIPPLWAHFLSHTRGLDHQPDDDYDQLTGDQSPTNGDLGGRADEARPLGSVLHSAEDPSNAVGLSEKG